MCRKKWRWSLNRNRLNGRSTLNSLPYFPLDPLHPPPPPNPLPMLDVFHWPPGSTSNIGRGVEGGREGQGSSCRWPQTHRDIDLAKIYDQDCLSRGKIMLTRTQVGITPQPLRRFASYFTGIISTHRSVYTVKMELFTHPEPALHFREFDFWPHIVPICDSQMV